VANIARLHTMLAFVESNPDLWDQGSWLRCFAAIAAELAGYNVLPSLWVRLEYRSLPVWDAATEVLDLTGDQARRLFAPGNTLPDLFRLVGEFTVSRPGGHLRSVG
jgi:hypothetical protein